MLHPSQSFQLSRCQAGSQPRWKRIICVIRIYNELDPSHDILQNFVYFFFISKFVSKYVNLCEKACEKIPLRQQQRFLFQWTSFQVNGEKKSGSKQLKIHKMLFLYNYAMLWKQTLDNMLKFRLYLRFFLFQSVEDQEREKTRSQTTEIKTRGGI